MPARTSTSAKLRQLFGDGSGWRERERSAALDLARAQKWDCVHTRINLGPGKYTLTIKGGATEIEVPGEPRIVPEVDAARFFGLLSGSRLDLETEAVVVVDLPAPDRADGKQAAHYVAMSRARSVLSLVYRDPS